MAKILTTDALVTTTKRRAMLPLDEVTFGKQGIIDILNEEVDLGLTSHILSVHEEYLVYYKDFAIDPNTNQYTIPDRAIGTKLRGAFLLNSNSDMWKLTRVELEDVQTVDRNSTQNYLSEAFYVENDKLILLNRNGSNASHLRMYFYMKISELVEDKFAGKIVNIDTLTNEVIVDKIPSTFQATQLFDITCKNSPNKLLSYDQVVLTIATNTKTLTFASLPTNISVGDYITIAETSIVPQVPSELHTLLAQRAAVACLEALNDAEGLAAARGKMAEIQANTLSLIDNRVESAVEKINPNYSPLKQCMRKLRRRR